MHGNTGSLGIEESCEEHSLKSGQQLQILRVGKEKDGQGFSFIQMTFDGAPNIEFGGLTPTTDMTTVFLPYQMVGIQSEFFIDPLDGIEKLTAFQILVNSCEGDN